MRPVEIKQLLSNPTITPEELYRSGILKISRNRVYEATKNKVVASIKVGGKKIIIPTAPLRRQLGIDDQLRFSLWSHQDRAPTRRHGELYNMPAIRKVDNNCRVIAYQGGFAAAMWQHKGIIGVLLELFCESHK